MKNTFITFIILCSFQLSIAQDQSNLPPRDVNKNEISISPINLIVFGALDIGYERVLTNNTTLGFDLFYRFSDNIDSEDDGIDRDGIFDKEIAFTTRFKYFFGSRVARGFYVESFGMLSSGENEVYIEVLDSQGNFIDGINVDKEFTDFALGFAVGGKFVARNGFFLDISIGIGRNLFTRDSPDIIVRPSLYLGYRF